MHGVCNSVWGVLVRLKNILGTHIGKHRKASERFLMGPQNKSYLRGRDAPGIGKHRKASESNGKNISRLVQSGFTSTRFGIVWITTRSYGFIVTGMSTFGFSSTCLEVLPELRHGDLAIYRICACTLWLPAKNHVVTLGSHIRKLNGFLHLAEKWKNSSKHGMVQ